MNDLKHNLVSGIKADDTFKINADFNILFISSINLSLNPRIYKEILLAKNLKYNIEVVTFNINAWDSELEKKILDELSGIPVTYISATRSPFLPWLLATLIEVACQKIYFIFKKSFKVSVYACSKRSFLLKNLLEKRYGGKKFDLVVAHTLSTLYPVKRYAQKTGSKFSFDVEDYHPGEKISKDIANEKKRREILLKKLLPFSTFTTSAAPLIGKNIEKLTGVYPTTVLNYFSKKEFEVPRQINSDKIKLVWFSININAGRGLELLLSQWEHFINKFELTLIGKLDTTFYNNFIKPYDDIIIKEPMTQKELHKDLSNYDVGLALEDDSNDYNRKLALTNKILAYFQSGLYILATNTLAQTKFLNTHEQHGIIIEQTSVSILNNLKKISSNKLSIRKAKNQRFETASSFSWENESEKIKDKWQQFIHGK